MAGYSDKPLPQKLGLKLDQVVKLLHAPVGYETIVGIPSSVKPENSSGLFDWIQAFYTNRADLESEFDSIKKSLKPDGQLWLSWPKKASGMDSDLNENIIRDIGLMYGLVDVKVAAIDETWSALKFVYRLKDRK